MAQPASVLGRQAAACRSLWGLAIGDAFGENFFGHQGAAVLTMVAERRLPEAPWRVTDDTMMAVAVVRTLRKHGEIVQQTLWEEFLALYAIDPRRGYGRGMHELLSEAPRAWVPSLATALFSSTGSMGNGSAMRVAPLGAYFHDDLDRCAAQARLSSEVTHSHPEGIAGAVAVACAAARMSGSYPDDSWESVFDDIIGLLPASAVRDGVLQARDLGPDEPSWKAAMVLGTGERVLAEDTVPFSIWSAMKHQGEFETAMWETVSGLGDRDTTCAIVAGILHAKAGCEEEVPERWQARMEPPVVPELRSPGPVSRPHSAPEAADVP